MAPPFKRFALTFFPRPRTIHPSDLLLTYPKPPTLRLPVETARMQSITNLFSSSRSCCTLMTGSTPVAHECLPLPLYKYRFTFPTALLAEMPFFFIVRSSISFWNVLIRLPESEMLPPLMENPRNLNHRSGLRYSTFLGLSFMSISDNSDTTIRIAFS